MEAHVAGIETADYEIAEVSHDVGALTSLFANALHQRNLDIILTVFREFHAIDEDFEPPP